LRAAALGKLGRVEEGEEALAEVRRLKPDFDERAEELLYRNAIAAEVQREFLDGLRMAGLRDHPAPNNAARAPSGTGD
jgi:hypothetical protein